MHVPSRAPVSPMGLHQKRSWWKCVERSLDVDTWTDFGLLFSIWQIPVDLMLQNDMTFLSMEQGRRLFWIWLLMKAPPCRERFAQAVSAGSDVMTCAQDAAATWHNLPHETLTWTSNV